MLSMIKPSNQRWPPPRIHGGLDADQYKSFKESFDAFDWTNKGKISYTSLQVQSTKCCQGLSVQAAMRRAGHNPTDVEVFCFLGVAH